MKSGNRREELNKFYYWLEYQTVGRFIQLKIGVMPQVVLLFVRNVGSLRHEGSLLRRQFLKKLTSLAVVLPFASILKPKDLAKYRVIESNDSPLKMLSSVLVFGPDDVDKYDT